MNEKKKFSFSKILVAIVICTALVDLQITYWLSYKGMENAEQLSIQLVITILGTVVIYALKSLAENSNIAREFRLNKELDRAFDAKTQSVLNSALDTFVEVASDEEENFEDETVSDSDEEI